jgi:hypothetical protein
MMELDIVALGVGYSLGLYAVHNEHWRLGHEYSNFIAASKASSSTRRHLTIDASFEQGLPTTCLEQGQVYAIFGLGSICTLIGQLPALGLTRQGKNYCLLTDSSKVKYCWMGPQHCAFAAARVV